MSLISSDPRSLQIETSLYTIESIVHADEEPCNRELLGRILNRVKALQEDITNIQEPLNGTRKLTLARHADGLVRTLQEKIQKISNIAEWQKEERDVGGDNKNSFIQTPLLPGSDERVVLDSQILLEMALHDGPLPESFLARFPLHGYIDDQHILGACLNSLHAAVISEHATKDSETFKNVSQRCREVICYFLDSYGSVFDFNAIEEKLGMSVLGKALQSFFQCNVRSIRQEIQVCIEKMLKLPCDLNSKIALKNPLLVAVAACEKVDTAGNKTLASDQKALLRRLIDMGADPFLEMSEEKDILTSPFIVAYINRQRDVLKVFSDTVNVVFSSEYTRFQRYIDNFRAMKKCLNSEQLQRARDALIAAGEDMIQLDAKKYAPLIVEIVALIDGLNG